MIAFDHLWLLALAMAADAVIGDPPAVWSRIPHPVAWLGALIAALDRALNRPKRGPGAQRAAGMLALAVVVAAAWAAGYALEAGFAAIPFGWIGTALVASVLLAGRSLYDHVAAVARALRNGGLDGARTAVARIVGRDVAGLDASDIARAAIESLAESLSDGVTAPALWFALLGLPGIAAYKAINTADSMIGHMTGPYRDFGWAAARLDDLVNLPASRLSALLVALAAMSGADRARAFRVIAADARRHASPNAGWPEAAMAGALDLALGGPKAYDGVQANDPWLNATGRRGASAGDITRALRIYLAAVGIFWAAVALAGLIVLAP